ncbi:cell wall hydrolase [Paenibacillus humicola]|uniref:cell wall hydrolase n=1 Tax=Paenibacillus humicola TaxID=3110540 RepID=UPI00237A4F39|nr:cell wall hydrolase [Paenibacillus humicola]
MYKLPALLVLFSMIAAAAVPAPDAGAAPYPYQKLGSKGQLTEELQFRLHTLGYLTGPVTDKFTAATVKALIRFQQHVGLPADGIAGPRTWKILKKLTVNKRELAMMARVIYGEARGESYEGQVAVGAVLLNRRASPQFPNTIRGVIFEPKAFTAVNDGQYWLIPDNTAFKAAKAAILGWDPTGNALFYYNPKISKSAWFRTLSATTRIGNHEFFV